MKILALDTTAWACSIALWENGKEVDYQEETTEKSQAQILPILITSFTDLHQIDLLLVNTGPGSFTGIRVGIAFAKGLSKGLNIPIKGMDSFTTTHLANGSLENLLILIEAHRQDVFAKRYLNSIPQKVMNLTRKEIEAIIHEFPELPIVGTGANSMLKGISYPSIPEPLHGARALAFAYFLNPDLTTDPLPYYAREADVTTRNTPSRD